MASQSFTTHALWLAPSTSIFLAGYYFATSHNIISNISDLPPQQSTPIFKRIISTNLFIVVPTVIISTAASTLLWHTSGSKDIRRLHLIAALATFAAMPTGGRTVKRLVQISEDRELQLKTEQNLEARQLLKKWARGAYFRTGLFVVGAVAGVRAAMLL